MTERQDESRLLRVVQATSVALGTWHTLATAPPRLRRRRVQDSLVMHGFRAVSRYSSHTRRLREIPPRLTPAERVLTAAAGVVAVANLVRLWSMLLPDRAEHRRKLREWNEQRARCRRLRHGWRREGFVGRVRLLAHMVRLPRVAASARWHVFSAGGAAAKGVIFYYTFPPHPSSELKKKVPWYPSGPISGMFLLAPLLRVLGLLPSSLWIPWALRLAIRAVVVLFGTLAGAWGGWHALRLAFVSPERLQRQHEEFQRETRRRQATRKKRL